VTALWYALIGRPWTSLAIISQDDSPRAWRLVQMLDQVARANQYRALKMANILDLTLERAEAIAHAVEGDLARRAEAPPSPSMLAGEPSPSGCSACDAVLLVLELTDWHPGRSAYGGDGRRGVPSEQAGPLNLEARFRAIVLLQ
jgi:hypothetical protein